MSASKFKKERRDNAANGVVNSKAARAAKEAAKERKENLKYTIIAIVFVLVAIFVLIWNSNSLKRNRTALTVGDTKYTAAEVEYYYYAALNTVRTSSYASYMGLDTSTALSQQTLSDTAKMLLGVSDEGDVTWDKYCMDTAKSTIQFNQSMLEAAEEADFGWTDELQEDMDETLDSVKEYAEENGYSYKDYVQGMYGSLVTTAVFEDILKDSTLISAFEEDYEDSLTYTDDEINTYYTENIDSFQVASYEFIKFDGTVSTTTDDEGNTVDATEEEIAAAAEAAENGAAAALERVQNGESMETIAGDYSIATYSSEDEGSNNSDTVCTWVFDSSRTAGDSGVVDDGTNYYVVLFHSAGRQEYNTVNVRHILFSVDSSSLDSTSETYDEDLAALQEDAKAEADKVLQQWKDGDATEESFAALADEYSDDGAEGGLYEQVYHDQMVDTFNDWCFDSSRQAGDVEIVESTYGYHIIYFVGQDLPYWQVRVTDALKNTDYSEWQESLQQEYTVTEGAGIKNVG